MKEIVALIFLLSTTMHYIQETTGNFEGKISTTNQSLIANATILITDTETNFKFGATSEESGYFTIANIPQEMPKVSLLAILNTNQYIQRTSRLTSAKPHIKILSSQKQVSN